MKKNRIFFPADWARLFLRLGFGLYLLGLILLPSQIVYKPLHIELATLVFFLAAPCIVLPLLAKRQYPQIPFLILAAGLFVALRIAAEFLIHGVQSDNLRPFFGLFYMVGFMEVTRLVIRRFGFVKPLGIWLLSSAGVVILSWVTFCAALLGKPILAWVEPYKYFAYIGPMFRLTLNFYNTTALIAYLFVGIFLAAALTLSPFRKQPLGKILILLNLPLAIAVGIFSVSKLLAFALGGLAWVVFLTAKRSARWWAAGPAGAFLLAGLILPLGVLTTRDPHHQPPEDLPVYYQDRSFPLTIGSRPVWLLPTHFVTLKQAAGILFQEHPLGIGYQRFAAQTHPLIEAGKLPSRLRGLNPHCTYLGVASESGLLGLLGLAIFMAATLRHFLKTLPGPLRTGLVGLGITWAFTAVHADLLLFPAFWFSWGLVSALGSRDRDVDILADNFDGIGPHTDIRT